MSKLRLLIKRPGKAHTCLPVTVDETDLIGNCISSLVDHLGLPRRDRLGRVLTYSLRPLSSGQPLSSTLRFADAQLLPETRLVLEADDVKTVTRPVGTSMSGSYPARVPLAEPPVAPSRQIVNRRTFVVGCILTGCAGGGLLTGMATALASRRPALSVATPPPHVSAVLQQTLLFSGHHHTVRAVSWSPDGTTVASGADDAWLFLWTTDGQVRQRVPHPAGVAALAWSPAGQRLASGSAQTVRFFDGRTAAPLAPARSAHTAQVTSLAWSAASGHPVISGSMDRRAIVWETQDYQPRAVFTRHTAAIDALACLPRSATIASASQGGAVRVWSVDTLEERHGFYQDAQLSMCAVAFAPTGDQLAVGGHDGQVRLWSNGSVCQHSVTAGGEPRCVDTPQRFRAHSAPVRAVAWSPDGRFLTTGGEDGILAIWTLVQGQRPTLLTTAKHADSVLAVAWSPDQHHIAAASGKTVTIWTLQA